MKIGLTVNGLHVEAHYPDDEIENVHKPLLRQLAKRHFASASRRTIVFLSAPPGTGKSTLTAFWEYLSRQTEGLAPIQTLPMDGFHHYNVWLEAHNLRAYKGAPETFDVDRLAQHLRQIKEGDGTWPQYDRQTHDPVEDAIVVTALRTRLVGRKLAGGLSQADADAFYARTDGPNVERVLRHSRPANVELMMSANGEYRLV